MRCADKHHPAPTRNVGRPPVSIPWMSEADDPCSADCKLRHHQETQIAVCPPPAPARRRRHHFRWRCAFPASGQRQGTPSRS